MAKINKYENSVLNVKSNYDYHFAMLFNRMSNMFEFENLPNTVDLFYLKYLLFLTGKALFFRKNNNLYVGNFTEGGELNEYYQPKNAIFANPVLGSENFKIGDNAIAVYTSSIDRLSNYSLALASGAQLHGICPTYSLIRKTAELLADCMTSINIVQKNARASYIVTAPTTASKNSVEIALQRIYSGEPYLCTVDGGQLDNVHVLPLVNTSSGNSTLKELRETYQFYLSQFYHSIGVGANSNFKRERLTDDEVQTENDPLFINILDMESTLIEGINEVNRKFGTNINVHFSEHWQRIAEREEETNTIDVRTQDTKRDSPLDSNGNG